MDNKERILSKAHELFIRYGIRSVSMDDIANQLGMSKKTLYQYYADKDELVNAVIGNMLEQNKTQCFECGKGSENAIHEVFLSFEMVEAMLAEMNPSLLFDMQKYHPVAFKKFEDFRSQFLYKLIKENLEQGMEEELYREDIDVDILTRFRIYSIMLSMDSEVFPSNKSKLIYIEQQLIEHFLYGLATPKGQKLIQKYKSQRSKIKSR
jgi:AcrR family transcriptional regulator